MAYSKELSTKLYRRLQVMGYNEGLCQAISKQLCTEFTATRMLGYLGRMESPPREEDLVDEMLAIMSDRDRIVAKHEMEEAQQKINEIYANGLLDDED